MPYAMSEAQGSCAKRQLHWCAGLGFDTHRLGELVDKRALDSQEASKLIDSLIILSHPNSNGEEEQTNAKAYVISLLSKYST